MWDEIVKNAALFSDAVLTVVDAAGYPVSVRSPSLPDPTRQLIRVHVPNGIGIQCGPAALLYHSHDERLASLKSFVVRGTLEVESALWQFRPAHFLYGVGFDTDESFLIAAARTAEAYLEQRGLTPPEIPWDTIRLLKHRIGLQQESKR